VIVLHALIIIVILVNGSLNNACLLQKDHSTQKHVIRCSGEKECKFGGQK